MPKPSEKIKQIYKSRVKNIIHMDAQTDLHHCIAAIMDYLDEEYEKNQQNEDKRFRQEHFPSPKYVEGFNGEV
jgi:hypothetical protein